MKLESHRRIKVWRKKAETAATYDHGVGDWVTNREARLIVDLLGGITGRMLDFPCGSGRLTRALSDTGYRVIAADLLQDMTAFTKKSVDIQVLQANIFEPPFRPGTFDAILAVRIFFHYPDQAGLLAALTRLLAPGGRLIFDTLNPFSIRRLVAPFLDGARKKINSRLVFSSPPRILELARNEGLRLETRKGLHLLPTRMYQSMPYSLLRLMGLVECGIPEIHRISTFWAFRLPRNERINIDAG